MPTIIFDLDHTLLNTHKVIARLKRVCIKHKMRGKDFDEAYKLVSKSSPDHFSLEKYGKVLKKLGYSKTFINKIRKEFTLSDFKPFLKNGAKKTLTYYKTKNYYLILLTKGSHVFQKLKIEQTGIKPFFKTIKICDKDSKDVWINLQKKQLLQKAPVWFVNDNLHETLDIANRNSWLVPILVFRQDASRFYDYKKVKIDKVKKLSELRLKIKSPNLR